MKVFVKRDNDIKEIQTEDLAFCEYLRYKKTAQKAEAPIPEPVKKGRKRSFTEDYKDEE